MPMNKQVKNSFRYGVIYGVLLLIVLPVSAAPEAEIILPFEKADNGAALNKIDEYVMAGLSQQRIKPAPLCSDAVFVRRVHLDLIGSVPEPKMVREFIESKKPDKRRILIDMLMEEEAYADYWALRWCDLLRVKAEFPINLWPNGVQAYHRWIHDSIKKNMPYDQFARELLTSSGSNFRVPQVNFYRAIQGQEPSSIARAVALTFMGTRLENWPEAKQKDMEAFFSGVAYKKTAEWKEEIIYLSPTSFESLQARFPDGKTVTIAPGEDPRQVFADWLTQPENPWFAKNIVNRMWAFLFGRGLIHEPDDIRPDNPPVHPQLLAYMEKEFVRSGYDLQHLIRLILTSRTYQQSSIPRNDYPAAATYFACYPVRQLDAEVLIDALCWFSGSRESYSSAIPEPFTFIPEENRSINLSDGSITSQFLEMFGRPSRDTGLMSERNNDPSEAQRLHLLNSTHVQGMIEQSWRLKALVQSSRGNNRTLTNLIYLNILSRYPSETELATAEKYFSALKTGRNQAANDLAWALINSKEFLFRH